MADSNLPSWFLWAGGITSALAAWAGLILSIRREVHERPKLRFLFEATPHLHGEDEYGQEYATDALKVTITNIGGHPIALHRVCCVFQSTRDATLRRRELRLNGAKVVHGEPSGGWIELGETPKCWESISVVDTTGKEWKPRGKELAQLLAAGVEAWPKNNPKLGKGRSQCPY